MSIVLIPRHTRHLCSVKASEMCLVKTSQSNQIMIFFNLQHKTYLDRTVSARN